MKIKKVLIIDPPTLDSIAALWLLVRFGEKEFPGVNSAKIEYCKPNALDNKKLYQSGVLTLNVEGGMFYSGRPEQEQYVCSFRLVYHHLALESIRSLNSIYECIVKYEEWRKPFDNKDPIDQKFHLTHLIHDFQNHYIDDPTILQEWLFKLLDAHYHMEKEWYALFDQMNTAPQTLTEEAYKVIKIKSSHRLVSKACHSKGYHACIQENPSNKNVMITWVPELSEIPPFQRTNLICQTTKKLRLLEADYWGMVYEEAQLLNPGVYCGWFLSFDREFVCFDRRSLPENNVTLIPHEQILETVTQAFDLLKLP